MKKQILLIVFSFFIANGIYSQLSLGVSGGVNLSTVKFVDFGDISPELYPQIYFGVTPKYSINSEIAILANLNFSPKGYRILPDYSSEYLKVKYTYLDINPSVEYKLLNNLALGIGMNMGIKLDEANKLGDGEWFNTKEFNLVKPLDFGLTGSIRAYYKNIYLNLVYYYGLSNSSNIEYTDPDGDVLPEQPKIFNRNLQIGIGYFFNLNKT